VSYNLLFIGATDPALLACNQPSLTGTVLAALRALLCPHTLYILVPVLLVVAYNYALYCNIDDSTCTSGSSTGSYELGLKINYFNLKLRTVL